VTVAALARVAALVVAGCVLAAGRPASAVDRTVGVDVAKPVAGGNGWSRGARKRLARDLDGVLAAAPTLRGAHVGLLILETRSGDVLYAHHADDAFDPASTLKLLTGSVALARLGPAFRFQTAALVDRAATTLVVRGGGDPLLRAADLGGLAQAVRAAGIHALAGGVRIDTSRFASPAYPPGWSWDDLVYDYAPVVSAATVDENVVHLHVTPGPTVGSRVTVDGDPPLLGRFDNARDGCPRAIGIAVRVTARTTGAGTTDTLDLARTPGGCIAVTGGAPLGSAAQTLDAAVPDPAGYLRALTEHELSAAGVVTPLGRDPDPEPVAAPAPTGAGAAGERLVWTHAGEPLADLLADMWWPSDNLVAELLLEQIGIDAAGLPGTTEHGTAAAQVWLAAAGIDPASVTLADGSGLSSYDRITPRALAAILQVDWIGPYRDVVLDALPIAGVRGTLAESFAGSLAVRRTFAKTGSKNHTRGLAGYLATLRHGAVTFAWSIDDWMGTSADLDALRARVLSRLIGD
jgi:D-alanyl-D-alanine carboxypeptidase/D-alanyl-D-alanine-endopeptidase (penicillin-binding protein 4)